ncbi:MAG TPA: nidogen-like domain-containing protein [Solirubrobacteraceae bacterium]|nr:nidogen-like domain-containing protein [Solirubrobacteraceae bacterium]
MKSLLAQTPMRRSWHGATRHGDARPGHRTFLLAIATALLLFALGAGSISSAVAGPVIPTSSAPGNSSSVINNYEEVTFGRNDDGTWPCNEPSEGVSAPVPCPGPSGQTAPETYPFGFSVNFFGTKYSGAFINNNGNLTFTQPLSQYTPESLTSFGSPIIAPYFADVDTRNPSSAIINFGRGTLEGKKVFVVNWPGVGCFAEIGSVLNNFQAILIDRPERNTGPNGDDFDIEFNYNQIQWDTGEASGGNEVCLKAEPLGVPAIAGYTNGSTSHFEIPGSEEAGAFLDSTLSSGLIHNSINSSTLGRYIFDVDNGQPPAQTTLTTSLAGGGQSGSNITVPEGTSVSDSATLEGENAGKAGGIVTYNVYSDPECKNLVATAGEVAVSGGSVPTSGSQTLAPGTYYWQARYSGDPANNGSVSGCGSEVQTVTRVSIAHWYSDGKPLNEGESIPVRVSSGGEEKTVSLNVPGAEIACNVAVGSEVIDTAPVGGGTGTDEVRALRLDLCHASVKLCHNSRVEVVPLKLPWLSHLVAGPPARDVIEGVEVEVRCSNGKVLDTYKGSLMPAIGNSVAEFGAGSGELEDGTGNKATVTGFLKLKGPHHDNTITAG